MKDKKKITFNYMFLDCEYQHTKHYLEGYRECVLTNINGEFDVWDKFKIDVDRYSPGSPRRVSYNAGWKQAKKDLIKIN